MTGTSMLFIIGIAAAFLVAGLPMQEEKEQQEADPIVVCYNGIEYYQHTGYRSKALAVKIDSDTLLPSTCGR